MKLFFGVLFYILLLCQRSLVSGQSFTETDSLSLLHANEIEVFAEDIKDDQFVPLEKVVITTINATNKETSIITYFISNGDNDNIFQINNWGKISLNKSPSQGFYHLTVLVKDQKQRNTSCSVLIFFKSINVANTVTAGSKTESWTEFQDRNTVPIYMMIGWEPILAFDIKINFEPSVYIYSNLEFLKTSPYSYIGSTDNNALRFAGVIGFSEKKRGFIKFAEIIISLPEKSRKLNFTYSYYYIIDRSLSQMKTINGCLKNITFDIHKDCQFDIRDVARLNYYQNLYKTVVVNSTNSVMDTDLNGIIDAEDVLNIYDIYVGNSEAILETQVMQPIRSSQCKLLITVVTKYYGISSWLKPKSEMFAVFTYPSSQVHDQLKESIFKYSVISTYFDVNSNIKYVDSIQMENKENLYYLEFTDWRVRAENVGISFFFYPSKTELVSLSGTFAAPRRITTTFVKKFDHPDEILDMPADLNFFGKYTMAVKLESSFNPQLILTSGITSDSCNNPTAPPVSKSTPSGSIQISGNKIKLIFSVFYLNNLIIKLFTI